ncbi:MAG: NrsF family protein [Burkholderiaceae bacterium]
MIPTSDVIDLLVANASPVRRLPPPLLRALLWLAFAALVLVLLVVGHGIRPDLARRASEPLFVVAICASLSTGVLAVIASFMSNVPDRSRGWVFAPLPALVVWLSTIGYGCLTHWVEIGPGGVHAGDTARCFATLMLTSLPLSLALLVMLRNGSMLRLTTVTITASLAIAGMTASAMSLIHDLNATAMILLWNLGAAAAIVVAGGCVLAIRNAIAHVTK